MDSLVAMLKSIGEKPPFNIRSFQVFPKSGSLREAMKAMVPADLSTSQWVLEKDWRYYDDENSGWVQQVQGLASDGSNWYVSRRDGIRKRNLELDTGLKDVGIPDELKVWVWECPSGSPPIKVNTGYDHFGDIDFFEGKLYVPLEHAGFSEPPMVLVFNSELDLIGGARLKGTERRHATWCAINPWDGLLYTSEDDDVEELYVYDPSGLCPYDPQRELDLKRKFKLVDHLKMVEMVEQRIHHQNSLKRSRVQGGVFSKNGRLYLSYHYVPTGIRCFCVLNGQYLGWQDVGIDLGDDEEIEGITLWDTNVKKAGKKGKYEYVRAQIHLAILDEDPGYEFSLGGKQDDLYLRHFSSSCPESL